MKRVGIAGATGLVGETLLRILESGPHKIEYVRLFASAKSAGTKLKFRDQEYEVKEVEPDGFYGLDVAFFCLEADLARKLVPLVARHCPVIDKASEFRLKPEVPLVVPEVNAEALKDGTFEVVLHVSATAQSGETIAFVTDLTYAGQFAVTNASREVLPAILLVECPRMLFPFARRVIADATRDGGFPPLLLSPIDFVALFRQQRMAAQGPQAQGAPPA